MQDPQDPKAPKSFYDLALEASEGMGDIERSAFMAQIRHETGDYKWNRELINRDGSFTKAQQGYGGGPEYRGRGLIQLTHKKNYAAYEAWAGLEPGTIVNNPSLMSEDEGHMKAAARWFWDTNVKPNVDDFTDTVKVTSIINGGDNGLPERQRFFNEYNTPEVQGKWNEFLSPKVAEPTTPNADRAKAMDLMSQASKASVDATPSPSNWYEDAMNFKRPEKVRLPGLNVPGVRDISELTEDELSGKKKINQLEFNAKSRSYLFHQGPYDVNDFNDIPHEVLSRQKALVEGKGNHKDSGFGMTLEPEIAAEAYDDLGKMYPDTVENLVDHVVDTFMPPQTLTIPSITDPEEVKYYGERDATREALTLAVTAKFYIEGRQALGKDVSTPYYNLDEKGLPTDPELTKFIKENSWDAYNDIAYGFSLKNAVEHGRIFAPGSNLKKIYEDMVLVNDFGTEHENLRGMTEDDYDDLPWYSPSRSFQHVLGFGGAATRRVSPALGIHHLERLRYEPAVSSFAGEMAIYAYPSMVTGWFGKANGWSKAKIGLMSILAGVATDRLVFRRGEGDLNNVIGHYWGDSAYYQTIGKHLAITADDTAEEARDKTVLEGAGIGALVEGVSAAAPPIVRGMWKAGIKVLNSSKRTAKNFSGIAALERRGKLFGDDAEELFSLAKDMDPSNPPPRVIEIIDKMDEPNIDIVEMQRKFGLPSLQGIQDFWDNMVSNLEDIHKRTNPDGTPTPDNIFKFYGGLHPDMFKDAYDNFKNLTKALRDLKPSDSIGREKILKQIDETVESMAGIEKAESSKAVDAPYDDPLKVDSDFDIFHERLRFSGGGKPLKDFIEKHGLTEDSSSAEELLGWYNKGWKAEVRADLYRDNDIEKSFFAEKMAEMEAIGDIEKLKAWALRNNLVPGIVLDKFLNRKKLAPAKKQLRDNSSGDRFPLRFTWGTEYDQWLMNNLDAPKVEGYDPRLAAAPEFKEDYAWMDDAAVAEHNKAVDGRSDLKDDLGKTTAKEELDIADTKFFDEEDEMFEVSAHKSMVFKKVKAWLGNHLGSIRFAKRIKDEGGNMTPAELKNLKAHQRAMFALAKRQREAIYQGSEEALDVLEMPLKGDGSIDRWLEGKGFETEMPKDERVAIKDKVTERDRILEAQKGSGEDKVAEKIAKKIKSGKDFTENDLTEVEAAVLETSEVRRVQEELDAANQRLEELNLRSKDVEDDDWMMVIEDDLKEEISTLEATISDYEGMAGVGNRHRNLPIRDRILSLESDIDTMSKSGAASKEVVDVLTEEIARMKGKLGEIEGAKLDPYLDLQPSVVKSIDKTLEKVQELGVEVTDEINELIRLNREYDEATANLKSAEDTGAEPGTLADVFSKEDLSGERNLLENRRADLHARLTRLVNLQPGNYHELAESDTIMDLIKFLKESAEEARTARDNFDHRVALYEQATTTAESKVVDLRGEIRALKKELKDGGSLEADVLDSTGEVIPKPKWAASLQEKIEKLEKKSAKLVAAAEKSSAKKADKESKKAAKLNKRFDKVEAKAEELHKEGVKARRKARTAEATVEKNDAKIEKLEREAAALESASLIRHQRDVLQQVRKFRKWLDSVPEDVAEGILEAAAKTRQLTKAELKALKDGGITNIYNDLKDSGVLGFDDEEVHGLLQQLDELDKELKVLKKAKKAEAGVDVKDIEKKVKAKAKTIQELEDELTALKNLSPEEAEAAAELVGDLATGLATAKQELSALQKVFDETPIGKLRKMRATLKASQSEKARVGQKIEDVDGVELTVDEAAEAAQINAKLERLREQNSLLRKEWKATDQGRLETSDKKAKQQEKKAAKLRKELVEGVEVDVLDELEISRTRVKALEQDLKLLEADAGATVEVAVNRIKRDLDEVERLQEFVDTKTGKVDPMREALSELQQSLVDYKNTRASEVSGEQETYNMVRSWLKIQKLRSVGLDTQAAKMMRTVNIPGSGDMAKLESMMAQNERRNGMNGHEIAKILNDFNAFGKGWGGEGTSKALLSWLDQHPIVGKVSPSRPTNIFNAEKGGRIKTLRGAGQGAYNYLKSNVITNLISGEDTQKLAAITGVSAQLSRMVIREMVIKKGFGKIAQGDMALVLEIEQRVRAMDPLPKRVRLPRRKLKSVLGTPSRKSKDIRIPEDGETKTGWGIDISEGELRHLGETVMGDDFTPAAWQVFMIENDWLREIAGVFQGVSESVAREIMGGLIDENLLRIGMDKVTTEMLISESVSRGTHTSPESIYQRLVAMIELENGITDGSIKDMDSRKWLSERLGTTQEDAQFLISVQSKAKSHQRRASLTNRVPTKAKWLQKLSRIPLVDMIALFMKTRANTASLAVEIMPLIGIGYRQARGLNTSVFDKITTAEMQIFGVAAIGLGYTISQAVDDGLVEIDEYNNIWIHVEATNAQIEKQIRRVLSVDPSYIRGQMESYNDQQIEIYGEDGSSYDPDNEDEVTRFFKDQILGEDVIKDGIPMVRKEVSPLGHLGSAIITGVATDRLLKGTPLNRRELEESPGSQVIGAFYNSTMNVFGIGSVVDLGETISRVVKDPTNITAISQIFLGNALSLGKQAITGSNSILSRTGDSYEGRFNKKEHLGYTENILSRSYWAGQLGEGQHDWTGMPSTRVQRTHFGSTNMEVLLTPHEIMAYKFALTIKPQSETTVPGFTGIDLYEFSHKDTGDSAYLTLNRLVAKTPGGQRYYNESFDQSLKNYYKKDEFLDSLAVAEKFNSLRHLDHEDPEDRAELMAYRREGDAVKASVMEIRRDYWSLASASFRKGDDTDSYVNKDGVSLTEQISFMKSVASQTEKVTQDTERSRSQEAAGIK